MIQVQTVICSWDRPEPTLFGSVPRTAQKLVCFLEDREQAGNFARTKYPGDTTTDARDESVRQVEGATGKGSLKSK